MKTLAFGLGQLLIFSSVLFAQEEGGPPVPVLKAATEVEPLPGTARLTMEGDLSAELLEGVHRFVDREIAASVEGRAQYWKRDLSSAEAYVKSVAGNRERFRDIIGMRDARVEGGEFEYHSPGRDSRALAKGGKFAAYTVRWPVFRDVTGEGLLLIPQGKVIADVVAIPDADVSPEQLVGIAPGVEVESQYARRLAESGFRVLVPMVINRGDTPFRISQREYLYRPAFELGRHIIGYEVQKVLAGIDCLERSRGGASSPAGVIGWGEGGLLALYAAAVDDRIGAACVSGYFGPRESLWEEPAYRNVFRLLKEFGDAEIVSLVAGDATIVIEAAPGPQIVVPEAEYNELGRPVAGKNPQGKPGRLISHPREAVEAEVNRAKQFVAGLDRAPKIHLVDSKLTGSQEALDLFAGGLGAPRGPVADGEGVVLAKGAVLPDGEARQAAQAHEIIEHNEWALRESGYVREEFMKGLSTKSLEEFESTVEGYREIFRKEVIGEFDQPLLDPAPRSRRFQEGEGVTSYEVVLDVFPDVIAYGILTVPDDLKPGERRPVVVCQHGLEGRPQDVIGEEKFSAYKAFATGLAQRGFVTFAPQNCYRGLDKFRLLQFKAQSLGKTLFSVIVPQHEQIVRWLGSLDFVDAERIAFYGLSYGGKSAMRIPPLVEGYCLSICSADFNEWVDKNASTRAKYSYANKREYEIFEWDLGSTFNYAEMAALIAPRPFMVERGHFDGVGVDHMVAYEFAKVRRLYNLLGIGERAEIEWFIGPHTINGKGTFDFLHKWLDRP